MSNWTENEDALLIKLTNEGGHTREQLAAAIGRAPGECSQRSLALRTKGVQLSDPERETPQGEGGGAGRPRNKRAKLRVSFRLAQDVKGALAELRTATGEKPGSLLRHALAVLLERDELYDVQLTPRVMDVDSIRVAACWSVPATLIDDAASKVRKPRYAAAEHAVIELLKAYGYTIESKT